MMEGIEMKKKVSELQCYLSIVYVVALLVSNIVANKQLVLPFGITMTGAVFVFPITYILSDLFSEVYGYRWSRITCYASFLANLFMVVVFQLVISTKAPDYWHNQEAFAIVLGNTPRILLASLTAYVIGDMMNDKVFRRMKGSNTTMKGFGARAFLSSVVGEVCDSAIFIPIAFIGQMPVKTLIIMGITQVSLKLAYELIILPVTTILTKKVGQYEESR